MRVWWLLVGAVLVVPIVYFGLVRERAGEVGRGEVSEPAWFADVTDAVGLDFAHDCGPSGDYFMPRLTGGGAAFLDFDKDGRLDIYLVQNGGPNSLSKNRLFRQKPDGRFEDISRGSGLDVAGYGQGVAVGDANGDGWPDIVVSEYGRIRLFLNNHGRGTFTESPPAAGLDNPLWATSAAFTDFDRDGRLDLVVANYLEYNTDKSCSGGAGQRDFCGPNAFPGTATKLFRNIGPENGGAFPVRFQDVTVSSGLAARPGPGLGVVCADFDGDGWPDIFVANDGKPNHLWINRKNGTFAEEAVLRGVAYNALGKAEANMGIAIGDVDGDGSFDLFVTHLHEESHRLWKQIRRGSFRDETGVAGLAAGSCRSTGFGTLLADFDNDGALDLVVANGKVKRDEGVAAAGGGEPFWAPYREANHLHTNDGQGRFRNRSAHEPALCGVPGVWRAVACGDVDGDGALDLLVTRVDGTARLLRNVAPNRGNWLVVRALDAPDREACGAEISVAAGARRWTRWAHPGYSYVASNDPRAHFGLGPADRVDEIRVRWPDGRDERFPGQAVNRCLTLRKGTGSPAE